MYWSPIIEHNFISIPSYFSRKTYIEDYKSLCFYHLLQNQANWKAPSPQFCSLFSNSNYFSSNQHWLKSAITHKLWTSVYTFPFVTISLNFFLLNYRFRARKLDMITTNQQVQFRILTLSLKVNYYVAYSSAISLANNCL